MTRTATAYITRVESGETRSSPVDWSDEGGDFMWSEGNYACDCNRALFFARAAGEPDPNVQCSDGQYSVRIVEGDVVLYEDAPRAAD